MRLRGGALALVVLATGSIGAQCRFARSDAKTTVTYRFRPEIPLDPLVLDVTMEFRAGDDGTAILELPTHYAGETFHSLSNVRALSKGVLLDPQDKSTVTVHARAHSNVVIEYEVHKDWTGPFTYPLQFHPVLMPEYVEITGSNGLVQLRHRLGKAETTNFDWTGLPQNWVLATSFGSSPAPMNLTPSDMPNGRCQSHTGQGAEVDEALFAAGDFRLLPFQINGKPAVLAIRGTWTFTDDSAIADLQKVVGNVRSFWHDNNFPYFLVTVAPYDQDHGSSDGSAYTNAFWMFVSRQDKLNGMLPQVAHESFHAWDPLKMGVYASRDEDQKMKWFKEGGTEYYAQLLTYKAGEQTAEAYVKSMNGDLRDFAASNSEYVRGRVISLWLDETIRKESGGAHSLDDVMFDMVKDGKKPLTSARLMATIDKYLPAPSQGLLDDAVFRQGDLAVSGPLPLLSDCTHGALEMVPAFDLGFDFSKSKAEKTVTGVEENGPAWKAGLRDGQPMLTWSIVSGGHTDAKQIEKVTIREGEAKREISYYPAGKAASVWQYQVDAAGCGVAK